MITIIIPYYRAPLMLKKQLEVVNEYSDFYEVVVVDDCSQEPASEIVSSKDKVSLYRIDTDIKWNREGARNLGVHVSKTDWIIHIDIDHILPVESSQRLHGLFLEGIDPSKWFRFERYRVGMADDTRKKDNIPDDVKYGKIKPHIDSYLCTKKQYWKAGGYNEEYSGCLGGGGPFLRIMKKDNGESCLLPEDVFLEVYTRSEFPDASVFDLSRSKDEFKKRKKKYGFKRGKNSLRFEWRKIK